MRQLSVWEVAAPWVRVNLGPSPVRYTNPGIAVSGSIVHPRQTLAGQIGDRSGQGG
jgi:hypothetical protein